MEKQLLYCNNFFLVASLNRGAFFLLHERVFHFFSRVFQNLRGVSFVLPYLSLYNKGRQMASVVFCLDCRCSGSLAQGFTATPLRVAIINCSPFWLQTAHRTAIYSATQLSFSTFLISNDWKITLFCYNMNRYKVVKLKYRKSDFRSTEIRIYQQKNGR